MRECGDFGRPPVGLNLPQHGLDLRVEKHARGRAVAGDRFPAVGVAGAAGVRQQVEARVFHRDRAAEQLAQRPADLVDALAVQHQLGETAVDVHGALQAPVLGVDDPL